MNYKQRRVEIIKQSTPALLKTLVQLNIVILKLYFSGRANNGTPLK